MANQEIEKDYEEIFALVYPQIADYSNGILYKVIHILLETEESVADQICNRYHIKDNASLDDDEAIVSHFIEKPNLLPFNDNWLKEKLRNVMNPDIAKVAWIVIIACILVGLPYCIQYFNRKQNPRGNARNLQPYSQSPQPLPPATAALCLVVPASVFVDLRDKHPNALEDNRLTYDDIKILIDNSSYFICTNAETFESKEQFLEITNEEIPSNSNREVYIRIHIDNGQEMIDKESPYILKRNLPREGQRIVQRYDCLKNLSGLEKFNRV